MVTQTVTCYHCGSTDLIRFGHQNDRQRYRCKGCGKTSRENKGSSAYDPARKAEILAAYQKVLPPKRHHPTEKGEGQPCHIERFKNILRQRMGRFVRCTLSFSKTDTMHENCLRLFLQDYNWEKRTT